MNTIQNPITGRDKLIVTADGVFDAITGRKVGVIVNGVVKSVTTGAAIAVVVNNSGTIDLSFITAGPGDILSGKVGADAEGKPLQGTIQKKSAATITPGTVDQIIAAGTYLAGKQIIKGDNNLASENIAEGKEIFGVKGTHKGGNSTKKLFCATLIYR